MFCLTTKSAKAQGGQLAEYDAMANAYEQAAKKYDAQGCTAAAACMRKSAQYARCLGASLGNGSGNCGEQPSCPSCTGATGGGGGARGAGNDTTGGSSANTGSSSSPPVNMDAIRNARVIDNSSSNAENQGIATPKDMTSGSDSTLQNVLNRGPIAFEVDKDFKDRARRYGGDIRDAGALGLLFTSEQTQALFDQLFKKLGIDWDSVSVGSRIPKPGGRGNLGPSGSPNGAGADDGVQCGKTLSHRVIDFNTNKVDEYWTDPCNPPPVITFPGKQKAPAANDSGTWCGLKNCPNVPHDPKYFASLEDRFKSIASTYAQQGMAKSNLEGLKISIRNYADSYIADINRRFRDFIEDVKQSGDGPPPTKLMLYWDQLQRQHDSLVDLLDRETKK